VVEKQYKKKLNFINIFLAFINKILRTILQEEI
jgi:hypothetical protein